MKNKTIETGINPMRFFGLNYSKRMYFLRRDPRPLLTVHLLFIVIWIRLPWSHVAKKESAARVCSYGGVIRLHPFYFKSNWG